MKLRIWTFAVLCFSGVLLGTLGTWSWRLGHGYSAIWPAIVVQVAGGIWFGGWGVLAGVLFPSFSNALAQAGPIAIFGYIPANLAQALLPAWAFRHFRIDPAIPGRKGLGSYVLWGACIPALAGAMLGSAAVVLFGGETWRAYPLLVLKWALPHMIVSSLLGIPVLRIFTPLWGALGILVKGWWGATPSGAPGSVPRLRDLPIQLKLALALCGPGLAPLIALSILEVERGNRLITADAPLSPASSSVPLFLTVSIMASILAVGWLSRHVIRPLLALKEQVESLKTGDDLSPTVSRKDEIGQVGRAFLKLLQQRQEAEAATLHEQERFRRLFEESPVAIAILREDVPLYVNSACLRMFGHDDLHKLQDACVMEQISVYAGITERAPNQGSVVPEEHEAVCLRSNGEKFPVRFTFTRVHFDDGPATMAFMQDITERRRLEEQLRGAQKMEAMGKLAGGIAHDFNNLMTIITGYGDLLLSSMKDDASAKEKVKQILKAGEQASALTRQLLAFTRRQMVQPKILDLGTILGDMQNMLRRVVSEDIELVISPGSGTFPIRADNGQIEQVILNLLINARDATSKGGRISVSVDEARPVRMLPVEIKIQDGAYVRLTVSDTGTGMDPETKARIFEPFFTTKEQGKGTGLGLATVYGIVEQSGGHITVESEPGKGTRFELYFPRAEGAVISTQDASMPEPSRGTETILLVEDQDGLRTLMGNILRRNGYTVLPASNGREGLQVAAEHREPIDLVVTDLIMPEVGGREVAETLPLSHPETRVLYMSGYVENINELLAQGYAFIDKPFSPEDLLRKIRQVLDRPERPRLRA